MGRILTRGWRWLCIVIQDELCPGLPQWMGLVFTLGFLSIGIWQSLVMGSLWPLGAGLTLAFFAFALAWPLSSEEGE